MSIDLTRLLVTALLLPVILGAYLATIVPLVGALVRLRAHYNPKGLQLDLESDVQPQTHPVTAPFFPIMFVRIYRIEGWSGLYKGLMPTFLTLSTTLLFLLFFSNNLVNVLNGGQFTLPSTGLGTLADSFSKMLIYLPQWIIIERAITTPHKLPYFNITYSLRILLTPAERRRPWILYLTPGLLVAQILYTVYACLFQEAVRRSLLPRFAQLDFPFHKDGPVTKLAIVGAALISAAVLTPLAVISTRLAIQRNLATPEFNLVAQEPDGDAELAPEYAGANEDVIALRTEREPYTGFIDCATKIIEEEGWSTLYRGWWWTMLVYGVDSAYSSEIDGTSPAQFIKYAKLTGNMTVTYQIDTILSHAGSGDAPG